VLIYPEGTRTRDGHIQQFKKGAFMLAVQTGIPIVPLTCNGAYKVLPRGSLLVRPGHIKVSVSDPIYTEGLSEADVPDLMNKTREAVLARFDPNYDPFTKDRSEDD
jgi:1-acyl-sn-glycerol-3-phosphate acyltransferase